MIQDIPKLYTALAEWLACVLFVRLLPQRYNAAKTAGILAAALPLFGLVQWLIGIVPLSLWIPGMIVALVLMYATIWLCCRLNFCDTGFWWALAFTLAEFVASLAALFIRRIKDAGQLVDTGIVLAGFLWRRLWRFSAT